MELGKNDAAIIFKENGKIELFLPDNKKDDDVAPSNLILAGATLLYCQDNSQKLINDFLNNT